MRFSVRLFVSLLIFTLSAASAWANEKLAYAGTPNAAEGLDVEYQHASEIAKQMGNLTPNEVISKAQRLKLSMQKSGDSSGSTTSRATGGVSGIRSSHKGEMLRPVPTVPARVSSVKDVFRLLKGIGGSRRGGIALAKALESRCRSGVGDPGSPDFRFCDCTAHDSLSYCASHSRLAYQNVSHHTRGASNNEDASR